MNSNSKVFGVLSYLGIFWIIGLVAAPHDSFTRFHVNQGLVLFIAELILSVARLVLGIISWIPVIGWIIDLVLGVGGLLCLVLAIIGIVNVAQGNMKPLPVIGGITLLR